jgi:hypothetical protein
MAASPPASPEQRIADLEKLVRDLRARLALIERRLQPRSEHPLDRETLQEKVSYDWQS